MSDERIWTIRIKPALWLYGLLCCLASFAAVVCPFWPARMCFVFGAVVAAVCWAVRIEDPK